MPTTDPIRRRKQNCENQKKFRERQNKLLEGLKATLEQQQTRINELEKETDRLKSLNLNANADISRLRDINNTLRHKQASQPGGRPVKEENETFNNDADFLSTSTPYASSSRTPANGPATGVDMADSYGFPPADFVANNTGNAFDVNSVVQDGQVEDIYDPDLAASFQLASPIIDDGTQYESQERLNASNRWIFMQHTQPLLTSGDGYLQSSSYNNAMLTGQSNNQPGSHDLPLSNFHSINGFFNVQKSLHSFPVQNFISKHISAVSVTLQNELSPSVRQSPELCQKVVNHATLWVMRNTWPAVEFCFKMINLWKQCYNYELWRHFPCPQTYYNLHPMFRPTVLQLTMPHNPTIDWIPWPAMRDKIILLQDRLDVDAICAFALEHTLLDPLPPSLRTGDRTNMAENHVTFHIWDLYLLEKSAGTFERDSNLDHKPRSSNLLALSDAYGLDVQDLSLLRLDTPFFERFPDFIAPNLQSKFKKRPLNLPNPEVVEMPRDLSGDALNTLKNIVRADIATHFYRATEPVA